MADDVILGGEGVAPVVGDDTVAAASDDTVAAPAADDTVAAAADDTVSGAEGDDTVSGEGEGEGAAEYEAFTLPEGVEVNETDMAEFGNVARELGLTQEQAQRLLTHEAERIAASNAAVAEQYAERSAKWASDAKADKEFGGDAFDQSVSVAMTAMEKFAGDDVRELMNETGLGNHPGVIRMFWKIGQSIANDGIVGGGDGGGDPVSPEAKAAKFYKAHKAY